MALALGRRQRRGHVIDVRDSTPPEIDRLRAIGSRPTGFVHPDQPASKCLVDDIPQGFLEGLLELLDSSGYVVVEGQRGSHASKQKQCDVMMSTCQNVMAWFPDSCTTAALEDLVSLIVPVISVHGGRLQK